MMFGDLWDFCEFVGNMWDSLALLFLGAPFLFPGVARGLGTASRAVRGRGREEWAAGDGAALPGAAATATGKRFLLVEHDTGVKGLGFLRVLSSARRKDDSPEAAARACSAE